MPPKSNVPIRICGSKSRSGCKTCKQRHVKCDERQPVCLRCEKGKRQCIYYDAQGSQTPLFGQGATPAVSMSWGHFGVIDLPGLDNYLSPYGPQRTPEISAVKHFAAQLGKELSGHFSDDVWCTILPRAAQHEQSIWHAIVAISSLDTSFRVAHSAPNASSDISLAVRHYSKAMQKVNERLAAAVNDGCKDVVLLSCILFAVFESLQNRFDSALRHITGGMKLLREWLYEAQSNGQELSGTYLNRNSLQPIFLCLDSQAVQMGAVGFEDYCSLPALNDQLRNPTSFATANEAQIVLNQIFNRISHWANWLGITPEESWIIEERQTLQAQFAQWDSAFRPVLCQSHPQPATLLLLLQREVLEIFFDSVGPSELQWDKSLPRFRKAVEYAEEYMELTVSERRGRMTSTDDEENARPVFTVTMDIVLPLFLISTKCRDSGLRWRALAMLKTCGRKEGIWDSYLSARVAERMIELEEKAALEDGYIPESARIFELAVRLDDDTGGDIAQKRHVPDEDGSGTIQTIETPVSW